VNGGLVDVDFVTQFLLLHHAPDKPEMLTTNTIAALNGLVAAGVLDVGAAEVLIPAMRLYQGLTQTLRMASDGAFRPKEAPRGLIGLLVEIGEMPDFAHLEAHLVETEKAAHAIYDTVLGRGRARKGEPKNDGAPA
jgi:glutamate-ammonia-ligase adenylyltransferase